ncbi:RluA family pseudouridine synthase [Paenibacillus oenotherae]|uniref:Pseudouridine synthase n=1 Tax=Paenibacillus oenotherae TaxID=1435645 RepID=A0ABS7D5M4_9BACL|nr:RluA family pseudouridine synthase [Paenibacillus oenotherae]MBW7474473.1 RluA family pseudouridine synthase [Paenibacillus oenotherae]
MSAAEIYYEPLSVLVSPEEDGMTVRRVLERRLGVSRKLLSRLKLTEQGITVNERRVYTSERVRQGDVVTVRMEQEESDDILAEQMPLDIVFEDRDLLIVNKPPGIVVHPTHGHYTGTLANGVIYHWKAKGEKVRFRPVHRLDEDTSGLVAIAKNPYVHQQLSEQLQRGEIDKRYFAYVYGAPEAQAGSVVAPIDRDPEEPHVRIVTPGGYHSVTHYETEAVYGGGIAAKVKLKLETGRTHQIRVHMKHIGCPLIGDKLYGYALQNGEAAEGGSPLMESAVNRQALHAAVLGLTHPITRETMIFEASLPEDLQRLESCLQQQGG